MRNIIFVIFTVLMINACAWQSEVLKIDDNTYQVSANASPARGGVTGARNMALTSANQHCSSLDSSIDVVDIQTEAAYPANGVATVTFKCD